ncbi:MAG: ATP-dependent sacrificial sulfur transferase LarE [Methanoregulaceae archaeon]|nr:ATP-dependent sacrificial sulfur transferase LarE [Methanoregulaceae archaeon]
MNIEDKKKALENIITGCGSMLVSFSGGVDSTLLAVLAHEVLGERCRAIFLDSPLVPRTAVEDAKVIAKELGFPLDIVEIPLMEHENVCKNPADRCYHCKKISSKFLRYKAEEYDLACIADGINVSDTGEHRPGLTAATEEGILHPFIMAGFTKEEIRQIAHDYGLPVWNKPSAACLASRVPYGDEITTIRLHMIEEAEAFLTARGLLQCRVRLHGLVARIEIPTADFEKLMAVRDDVVRCFKTIGFSYTTLDLAGYRSGSMDEVL